MAALELLGTDLRKWFWFSPVAALVQEYQLRPVGSVFAAWNTVPVLAVHVTAFFFFRWVCRTDACLRRVAPCLPSRLPILSINSSHYSQPEEMGS
jgi:hypothetical protein